MAKNETKRLKPSLMQVDQDCFAALERLSGYAPLNAHYALEGLRTTRQDLLSARQTEGQAMAAAAAARQRAVAQEWEFHNLILGAKDQVIAQFGRDSDEAAAVGLKKKSEYKRRTNKSAVKGATGKRIRGNEFRRSRSAPSTNETFVAAEKRGVS